MLWENYSLDVSSWGSSLETSKELFASIFSIELSFIHSGELETCNGSRNIIIQNENSIWWCGIA